MAGREYEDYVRFAGVCEGNAIMRESAQLLKLSARNSFKLSALLHIGPDAHGRRRLRPPGVGQGPDRRGAQGCRRQGVRAGRAAGRQGSVPRAAHPRRRRRVGRRSRGWAPFALPGHGLCRRRRGEGAQVGRERRRRRAHDPPRAGQEGLTPDAGLFVMFPGAPAPLKSQRRAIIGSALRRRRRPRRGRGPRGPRSRGRGRRRGGARRRA